MTSPMPTVSVVAITSAAVRRDGTNPQWRGSAADTHEFLRVCDVVRDKIIYVR
jgi:hypothetical protein